MTDTPEKVRMRTSRTPCAPLTHEVLRRRRSTPEGGAHGAQVPIGRAHLSCAPQTELYPVQNKVARP
jgi:hypothetical protein